MRLRAWLSKLGSVFAQVYPQAAQHLEESQEARRRLAALWERYLDDGLVEVSVVTDPDGTGRITVLADWSADARAELTRAFENYTAGLWACLDALVSETVDSLGILQRPREPQRPRFSHRRLVGRP